MGNEDLWWNRLLYELSINHRSVLYQIEPHACVLVAFVSPVSENRRIRFAAAQSASLDRAFFAVLLVLSRL